MSPEQLFQRLMTKGNPRDLLLRSEIVDAVGLAELSGSTKDSTQLEELIHLFKLLTVGVSGRKGKGQWLVDISRQGIHSKLAQYLMKRFQIPANAEFFLKISSDPEHRGASSLIAAAKASHDLAEIKVRTSHDIQELLRLCLAEGRDCWVYPVTYLYNPREFIQRGFLPSTRGIPAGAFVDYVEGLSYHSLQYWWGTTVAKKLQELESKVYVWDYRTEATHHRLALEGTIVLPYHLPHQFYRSGRYRHSMERYLKDGRTFERLEVTERGFPYFFRAGDRYLLPVMAYGAITDPMMYYYEVESSTYLEFQSAYVAFNLEMALDELSSVEGHSRKVSPLLQQHSTGELPDDLMLSALEVNQALGICSWMMPKWADKPHYAAAKLDLLWNDLEGIREEVRTLAAIQGYDVVILTSQINDEGVNIRVLDTRLGSTEYLVKKAQVLGSSLDRRD